MWEDDQNRTGGTCKLKFEENVLVEWEELVVYTLNEDIVKNFGTINGISFNPKNNHTIIKIWNSTDENIQETIHPFLKNKYKDISMRYDINEPQY